MFNVAGKVAVVMLVVFLSGCGMTGKVTRNDVQSFEFQKQGLETGKAIDKMMGILVDRGFDVKFSSKESGLITTEYKKFASSGTNPPFDYYMQIKGRVKLDATGKTIVQLSPIVKEQNRLNVAAYTEHELSYYTGTPGDVNYIKSMQAGGWRVTGQVVFNNVANDVAGAFGMTMDQVKQNVTTTPENVYSVQ